LKSGPKAAPSPKGQVSRAYTDKGIWRPYSLNKQGDHALNRRNEVKVQSGNETQLLGSVFSVIGKKPETQNVIERLSLLISEMGDEAKKEGTPPRTKDCAVRQEGARPMLEGGRVSAQREREPSRAQNFRGA